MDRHELERYLNLLVGDTEKQPLIWYTDIETPVTVVTMPIWDVLHWTAHRDPETGLRWLPQTELSRQMLYRSRVWGRRNDVYRALASLFAGIDDEWQRVYRRPDFSNGYYEHTQYLLVAVGLRWVGLKMNIMETSDWQLKP